MIHHLSYPAGYSVNDFIPDEICEVEYSKFDDATEWVAKLGPGCLLAKADIKSAFRLMPIATTDFELLGMKFEGQYYVDKCLPMGIRCAPAYFEAFSSFIEFTVKQRSGQNSIVHFVDDFLCIQQAKKQDQEGKNLLIELMAVCKFLGVPLADEKTEGPTTKLTYLGLEIDTIRMQVRVPQNKLCNIREKINKAIKAGRLQVSDTQSLIGSLSFICRAVKPGRAFLRRLIDTIKGNSPSGEMREIPEGAIQDLKVWLDFLAIFNGSVIIQEQKWLNNWDVELVTDASGGIGFGAYFKGRWFNGRWPAHRVSHSIAWKEMFPIVAAVCLWGADMAGKRVRFHTDNMAVKCKQTNKQTSKCPKIMALVRYFVLVCLKFDISFKAVYINTKVNLIADSLSRFQMGKFRTLVPNAACKSEVLPGHLWQI